MGLKIQGKIYREAKCVKCGFLYHTDESNLHGLKRGDLKDLKGIGYKLKVGDDLCIGCCLDFWDDKGMLDDNFDAKKMLDS